MRSRLEFRERLFSILQELGIPYTYEPLLDSSGSPILDSDSGFIATRTPEDGHLYFQPPPTVHMRYPAIVYELAQLPVWRADNIVYNSFRRYTLTAIDKDPDSALPEALLKLPMCSFSRFFASDGLNHWVFDVYF